LSLVRATSRTWTEPVTRDPAVRRSEKRSLGGLPNMSNASDKMRLSCPRSLFLPRSPSYLSARKLLFCHVWVSHISPTLCLLHFSLSSRLPGYAFPRRHVLSLPHARLRRPSQSSRPTGPVSGVVSRQSQCMRHFSACCRQHTFPSPPFD
jgi:hypothetical protein